MIPQVSVERLRAAVTSVFEGRKEPDIEDFQPGLLSIQESPPGTLPRAVIYLIGSLFFVLLVWATFGRLDIIAGAEGRLVPQTYVKIVQPAEAGIVKEIAVREGQSVVAGQVLMRMDTALADADARTLANEIALRRLQLRRIDAELTGSPLVRKQDDTELFRQIEAQYQAHRQAYLDAVAQEKYVLEKARHDLASAEEVKIKLAQVVPVYQRSAAAYEKLGKEGFMGTIMVEEKLRDRIEKEQDFKAQDATVKSLQATIAQSEKRLAQATSNYRSQLQNERVETEAQLKKFEQERSKHAHKSELLELRAPQAGIVKDIATHTSGTVVSPGAVLMNVVPYEEPLQAEVLVKNEDVGFVHSGQKAKIKLVAYPFQKYGMIDGTVVHVGADASDGAAPTDKGKGQQSASPLTYKALVRLDDQALEMDGKHLKLSSGMQVIAEIHQGSRTVMEYLLSPVQKAWMEAARER